MNDKEIRDAVERFSATDWVNPYNRKAMKTLLDLAQRYLSVKMPEKKELARKIMYHKAQATLSETQCEVIANEFIDECRLFYADKLLGLEEVIKQVAFRLPHEDARCYNIQYLPFLNELATAIRKHMEE